MCAQNAEKTKTNDWTLCRSISIWRRLYSGGHRQTQTMSSSFSSMQRWQNHHYKSDVLLLKLWNIFLFPLILPVPQGVATSTASCVQLHKRAEKIAAALTEKGSINTGENVVLLYPPGNPLPHWVLLPQTWVKKNPSFLICFQSLPGIDLIAAFYGCLYAGCVPVNVRPPHPQNLAATLPTVRMIIDVSRAARAANMFLTSNVSFKEKEFGFENRIFNTDGLIFLKEI